MSFDTLLPLIKKTGSPLSPAEFQNTVNVVFHDVEAVHYDAMHANMWQSLQEQISLLVNDIPAELYQNKALRLLDIGCGTGLSTELLLNTTIGAHINHVTLLDTSPNMLSYAKKRSEKWNKEIAAVNADIEAVNEKYDVVMICSVLHHIPDLAQFLSKVKSLQQSGAILIHLQDPNGDFINDSEYMKRVAEYGDITKKQRSKPGLIPQGLKNQINNLLGRKTYIDLVNDKLIEKKAIKNRMTSAEIWSVTDIHVEDLPFSTGTGIALSAIQKLLDGYQLLNRRSYGFFGPLKSELNAEYQNREQELIAQNKLNGRNVSAVWIKQ